MPSKVAFATTNWKDKPDKPDSLNQAQWDAMNSSAFNGFPFPFLTKDQENNNFSTWDGETMFEGKRSKSSEKKVSVLGTHYSYKFTYDQLFHLFWRMSHAKPVIKNLNNSLEPTNYRESEYSLSGEQLSKSTEQVQKDDEKDLVQKLDENHWKFTINDCEVAIYFDEPILKTGENEYCPYVSCSCCTTISDCAWSAIGGARGFYSSSDLPDVLVSWMFDGEVYSATMPKTSVGYSFQSSPDLGESPNDPFLPVNYPFTYLDYAYETGPDESGNWEYALWSVSYGWGGINMGARYFLSDWNGPVAGLDPGGFGGLLPGESVNDYLQRFADEYKADRVAYSHKYDSSYFGPTVIQFVGGKVPNSYPTASFRLSGSYIISLGDGTSDNPDVGGGPSNLLMTTTGNGIWTGTDEAGVTYKVFSDNCGHAGLSVIGPGYVKNYGMDSIAGSYRDMYVPFRPPTSEGYYPSYSGEDDSTGFGFILGDPFADWGRFYTSPG